MGMITRKWIFGSLAVGCTIFAISPGPKHFIDNPSGWELREQLVYLTGICAMSLMVLSMVLSARFDRINGIMGGLDKSYIVHKWVGIICSVFVILHWLLEAGAHWLVDLNLIPNPGDLGEEEKFSELEVLFFKLGVTVAEFVFYIFVILIVIALLKRIPYHFFRLSHKIFPVVFLLLSFHAATAQLKEKWLESPAGYLLIILLAIGIFSAFIGLFQLIGRSRMVNTVIEDVVHYEKGILEIRLRTLDTPWKHRAGQYAFLRFEHDKEPHPFTIASSGDDPNTLRFVIKGLGDFTKKLSTTIDRGQHVKVEGPYGEFTFEDDNKREVWIAGGIGITPFIARLEYLSKHGGSKKQVDFWYCTRGPLEEQYPKALQSECKKNGVNFRHLNSMKNEYLTIEEIKTTIGDFGDVSIWFCGPKEFADNLQNELRPYRFEKAKFHYDNFSMR